MRIGVDYELTFEWLIGQQEIGNIEEVKIICQKNCIPYLLKEGNLYSKFSSDLFNDFVEYNLELSFENIKYIDNDIKELFLSTSQVQNKFKELVYQLIHAECESNKLFENLKITNYN